MKILITIYELYAAEFDINLMVLRASVLPLLCCSAPMHVPLKARFVKFIHKALNHKNSVIKSVTKYACNNPMSAYSRNWSEFACVKGVVTKNVKEIYNECYGSMDVKEMDNVSVLNDMIDDRCKGWWGSCSILYIEDVNLIINDTCTFQNIFKCFTILYNKMCE